MAQYGTVLEIDTAGEARVGSALHFTHSRLWTRWVEGMWHLPFCEYPVMIKSATVRDTADMSVVAEYIIEWD